MQNAPPAPPCPKCGKGGAKAIAKKYDFPPGKRAWTADPRGISYTYECECGVGFTQSVKIENPKSGR